MAGWFMRARAWRSDSKRSRRTLSETPARMSLMATRRWRGAVYLARQTWPMPASPRMRTRRQGPMVLEVEVDGCDEEEESSAVRRGSGVEEEFELGEVGCASSGGSCVESGSSGASMVCLGLGCGKPR